MPPEPLSFTTCKFPKSEENNLAPPLPNPGYAPVTPIQIVTLKKLYLIQNHQNTLS